MCYRFHSLAVFLCDLGPSRCIVFYDVLCNFSFFHFGEKTGKVVPNFVQNHFPQKMHAELAQRECKVAKTDPKWTHGNQKIPTNMKKNSFLIIQFLSEILDRQKMAGISVCQNSGLELAVLGKGGLADSG